MTQDPEQYSRVESLIPDRNEFALIVNPMTDKNGRPLVKPKHVVDAFIVSMITFFSLLLGTAIPEFITGEVAYITIEMLYSRLLTAGLAFGLTFFAQWARYRGILIMIRLNGNDGK